MVRKHLGADLYQVSSAGRHVDFEKPTLLDVSETSKCGSSCPVSNYWCGLKCHEALVLKRLSWHGLSFLVC